MKSAAIDVNDKNMYQYFQDDIWEIFKRSVWKGKLLCTHAAYGRCHCRNLP